MLISIAMKRGDCRDPLEAALMGSLSPQDSRRFSQTAGRSDESLCELRMKKLYATFPHLGLTVRACPALATVLEDMDLLPRIRPWQEIYRQEIHLSLWGAVAALHDRGQSKNAIAALLAKVGL